MTRRRKKGARAKSGQWWRREPATLLDCLHRIVIDEHHDSRRVMSKMHDEVDTDTGRGSIWIPKEKWPAGRTSAATDTTIMEALGSHRRTNE